MMNISVVIPNFNGETLLRQNLPKVFDIVNNYKDGEGEIIITDDSSRDGSVTFLRDFISARKKEKTQVVLLENKSGKNKGFSANVNKGVAHASGDIVILLNTDVVPHEDFLKPLIEHFTDTNVFAVGCMDESVEDGKVTLRGRGKGEWKRGFLVHSAADIEGGSTTLWVSGGSGAFRKILWNYLGGLNDLYNPFYWEDIDLSYKAQKAGYKVLFEKKSIVRHVHEEGSIKKNYSSFAVRKTAYRNQFFFTWLNATDTIILVNHIFFLPYFLFRALMRRDRAFFVGFFLAIIALPKVLQERNKIQKLVKKTDREVIRQLKS